jgi:TetR/AcrR family transcriptional repressor of nem operon
MARRRKGSERTGRRDRIVEAARVLFWEQGYASTGMAQILEAADARSGSLYHFFPTKEDLLLAILDGYKRMLGPAVLEPVAARVSDPIERVFGILDGYRRQLVASGFTRGCPIGNLALEISNAVPAARKRLAENFDLWRAAVADCFDRAKGRLPPGTDTDALALFVLTTMEGAVLLARTYRDPAPYDAAVSFLRDSIERLITGGTRWDARPAVRRDHASSPSRGDRGHARRRKRPRRGPGRGA